MHQGVRQYPCYKVTLPVELRSTADHVPARAQIADISLGGCYVEMTFTKDLASEVELTLWFGEETICAAGIVVSSHPSFGNGIKFTEVKPESRQRLLQFLESLKPQPLGPRH